MDGLLRGSTLLDAPFTAAMARADGVPESVLRQWSHRGLVTQVLRGVWSTDSGLATDVAARCRAVSLVLPPGAVIGRSTAAWLHGHDPRSPAEQREPIPVECLVPRGTTPPRRPWVRAYTSDLVADDIEHVDGVALTSGLRTAIDLARWRPHWVALGVLDEMLRLMTFDQAQALVEVERWAGDRWIDRARLLLRWADGRAESHGESWTRLRIHEAGLPVPTPQVVVRGPGGGFLARLDLGDEKHHRGYEYDGVRYHSRPEQLAHDRARRARVEAETDWRVHAFGMEAVLGGTMALEEAVARATGVDCAITRRRLWT